MLVEIMKLLPPLPPVNRNPKGVKGGRRWMKSRNGKMRRKRKRRSRKRRRRRRIEIKCGVRRKVYTKELRN